MAKTILQDFCIACGLCVPECPNAGIDEMNGGYYIQSEACTECYGFYISSACTAVCPVDAIETVSDEGLDLEACADLAATFHPSRFPRD